MEPKLRRSLVRSLFTTVSLAAGFAIAACTFQGASLGGVIDKLVEGGIPSDASVKVQYEMHLERFDTTTGQFETLSPPAAKRNLFVTMASKGKVVVIGGVDNTADYVDTVEVYDPATKTWRAGKPWPRPRVSWWVEKDGLVCAIGGYRDRIDESVTEVDCYDVEADAWSARAPLPTRIDVLDPIVTGGTLYVLGGMLNNRTEITSPLDVAFAYDFTADTWTPRAKLPVARGAMAVRALANKLYLVGGYSKPSKSSDPVEKGMLVYEPSSDTWSNATQMPQDRQLFATDVLGSTLVTYFGLSVGPLLDRYDATANTWRAGTEPTNKVDPGVYTRVVQGGNLYLLVLVDKIAGGGTQASGKLWKYDPVADQWSIAGQRGADSRDALFEGAPIDGSIFFVGAFTQVKVTGL